MNSKNKGNGFERDASKKLSLWASNGKRKDLFFRTHSSGGRYTQNLKLSGSVIYNQAGDVTSTHPDTSEFSSCFIIETKFYKDFDFFTLLKTNTKGNQVLTWWDKLCGECRTNKKLPFMILKFNNKPTFIVLSLNFYETSVEPNFKFDYMMKFKNLKHSFAIVLMDEFFKKDYNQFMEVSKQYKILEK